jgi:hypothetical protein
MGLFGDNTQNVVVSQATNGKATATLNIPVPFWEIVVIVFIIAGVVHISCTCIYKKVNKCFNKKLEKRAKQIIQSDSNLV